MTETKMHSDLLTILNEHRASDFYIGNHIPPDKLSNAIAYFPIHRNEHVIGLIDCTLFGSCKLGLAITLNGLIWKNDWTIESTQYSLTWHELVQVENTIKAESISVVFVRGVKFNLAGCAMKPAEFIKLCLALIEHFSLKKPDPVIGKKQKVDHGSENTELAEQIIYISLFARFAKSDGNITQNEIGFFEDFFDSLSDHDTSLKKIFIEVFNKVKDDENISIYNLARKISDICISENTRANVDIYDYLWQLALIDGKLSSIKRDILKKMPAYLGLVDSVYVDAAARYLREHSSNNQSSHQQPPPPQNNLSEHFNILGLSPNASDAEVKTAYRKKMSSLHPDKLQSKELADELLQFATQQVQKINRAYEEIMKYRGT